MGSFVSIRVDEKGRLSIPVRIRQELGINPGDTLFCRTDGHILEYAKVEEDPFEILAKHALKEYEEGKTVSLEDYAKKRRLPIKSSKKKNV